jgi:hypothetical protein
MVAWRGYSMVEEQGLSVARAAAHIYIGRDRFDDYTEAVRQVPGGTMSPGGAALRMHVTRQYVHYLMKEGKLEFWLWRPGEGRRAHYCEIAIRDVDAFIASHGKGQDAEFSERFDNKQIAVL